MKIGIDIRVIGKNRTGDEVYFFNLVKGLAEIDKENNYFLFTDRNPEQNAELSKEIKKLGLGPNFKIEFIRSANRFLWNFWHLPMFLKKNPVDIYHTQYIVPFWLPKKIKLVSTIHDISFNYFPEYIKKSDLYFLKTLIPRSIRKADRIIAVSRYSRDDINSFYNVPAEKVAYTHNSVDFEFFNQNYSDQKKDIIRNKYGLPDNFLLYIGTLQPRKNIPFLIDAFGILVKKHNQKNLKLVIAGNRTACNFDQKIDEAIENNKLHDRVVFTGWVDEEDKPVLYKLAACFVFPSLFEGFGIPIIESMASGTPVVSSNKTSLPEVGKDGALFFDPQNSEEFSEKINQVLTDGNIRGNLAKEGLNVAKGYSRKKMAENTLVIYNELQPDR